MARRVVVLAEHMYHPAGEELLASQCELRVLRAPTAAAVREAARDANALCARYPHRIDEPVLAAAPQLVIATCSGRGTDAIDIEAATRHGVAVVNNPGFGAVPVSEAALGLILALAKGVLAYDRWMRHGEGWQHRSEFSRNVELKGKTLGVVGFGQIGSETARKAIAAFGMQVLVWDPYVQAAKALALGADMAESLEKLLERSDVVSLHPELTSETLGMIGENELRRMRPSAFLVNTSRGKVVQQEALVRALREGWISGAALDVYEDEPQGPGSPLYELDNVILMPHVAGLTEQAVEGMSLSAARQVLQALAGERPPHLLNPEAWPRAAERANLLKDTPA